MFVKKLSKVSRIFMASLALLLIIPQGAAWAETITAKYANVLVSDPGQTGNLITNSNTSTSIAVSPSGKIYVVYHGSNGIRVAKSTNGGQSFDRSVQVDSSHYEPSIAVSSSEDVYVSWSSGRNIYISKSTDFGKTFSTPTVVGAANSTTVHLDTDGQYIYLVTPDGMKLWVSNDGGSTFKATPLSTSQYVFSDVHVDPANHNVIVVEDDPSIKYYISKDFGNTFSEAIIPPNASVFYSVGSVSAGLDGHYLYAAGANSIGYKFDITSNSSMSLKFPNNASSQGRSLQADGFGNVATGYSDGSNVYFSVSQDFGSTFGLPVTVTAGNSAKAAINTTNGDLMFLYTQGGQVYLNIYANQLIGYNPNLSATSLAFETPVGIPSPTQTVTMSNTGGGPVDLTGIQVSGPFTEINTCPETLFPGESCTITVGFNPTEEGTFTGQVSISTNVTSNPRTIQLVGVATAAPLTVESSVLPDGTVGTPYSQTLSSIGGSKPVSWSLDDGALPAGLSLSSDGTINGTPTSSETSTFTVKATDSSGTTSSKTLTLKINPAPAISTSSLADGTVGAAYQQVLALAGGTEPTVWSVTNGTLPDGLSLSKDGVITGTPSISGTTKLTVQAKDSNGAVATKELSVTVNAAPIISSGTMPDGTVGADYAQAISLAGGTGPMTWSVISGSLPSGLSLTSAGVVTGTPAEKGTNQFTVKAVDANGVVTTKQMSLAINAAPVITTRSLQDGTVGAVYSKSLTLSGGTEPASWSITDGSLPDGVRLVGSTITGTPKASGTNTFTVKVTDANGISATQKLTLKINAAPSISTDGLPAATEGASYHHVLIESDGTGPFSWKVKSGSLPKGLTLSQDGALSGNPANSGDFTFSVGVTDVNGVEVTKQLTLKVNPAPSISTESLPVNTAGIDYNQALSVSNGTGPYTWTIKNGSLPSGLSLSSDGIISGKPAGASNSKLTVQVTDANGVAATKDFTLIVNAAPSINNMNLSDATSGAQYQQALSVSGGTGLATWSLERGKLPEGLVLSKDGVISGSTTVGGTSQFTVKVQDALGATATKTYSLTVNAVPTIPASQLKDGTENGFYQSNLSVKDGTGRFTWTLKNGSLPSGLSLSPDGVISGTPLAAGSAQFTVQVTDVNGVSATQTFELTIHAAPSVGITQLPGATLGGSYKTTLPVHDGTAPFTWKVSNGQLPDGLTLKEDGTIEGTPSKIGDSQFTVQVQDANGVQVNQLVSIHVNNPLTISDKDLPMVLQGTKYQQSIETTGGTNPVTFTVADGTLPDGLKLNPDGSLEGTSMTTGVYQFSLRAVDANGVTATHAFSMYVIPAAPTEVLKTIGEQQIVGQDGATMKTQNGESSAILTVPSGAYSLPIQINLTSGDVPSKLISSNMELVSAFGVNFNSNYVPDKPMTLTISNAKIDQNSKVYKIVDGKLVPVKATLSSGKAVIEFDVDPDFVVLNTKTKADNNLPTTANGKTVPAADAGKTLPTATASKSTPKTVAGNKLPNTALSFMWTFPVGASLLLLGSVLFVVARRKQREI